MLDLRDHGADPAVSGGRAQMPRTLIMVRRSFLAVVALSFLVLALLVLMNMVTGDGEAADAAVDGDEVAEVRETVEVEVRETVDVGVRETVDVDVEVAGAVEVPGMPVTPTEIVTPPTEPAEDVPAPPVEPPPFPAPFEPALNEVQADAKRLGTTVAYVMTNYQPDSSTLELAAGVTADAARALALASAAEPVHHPGMWSRGTIEYAQLGGHLDGGISIMVVIRQELGLEGAGESERTETRTMDVRLVRIDSGAWEFDELASAGGQPVARPADLSPLAVSVVDNPRIGLPDSAIWDIYSGHTDAPLLRAMSDLAEKTPYSVAVLHTGHPSNVFGTDRLSNHTVGRAVDIYELGSELVIDSHDVTSSIHSVSEWLASRSDLKEFGSPWRFNDAVAHTFTNEVHHDHLHVGVFPEG